MASTAKNVNDSSLLHKLKWERKHKSVETHTTLQTNKQTQEQTQQANKNMFDAHTSSIKHVLYCDWHLLWTSWGIAVNEQGGLGLAPEPFGLQCHGNMVPHPQGGLTQLMTGKPYFKTLFLPALRPRKVPSKPGTLPNAAHLGMDIRVPCISRSTLEMLLLNTLLHLCTHTNTQ